jgi:nickel-dependent lactate racemase
MKQTIALEVSVGCRKQNLVLPDYASELRLGGNPSELPIESLVDRALEEPLEFPPLPLALIDDDHVAIAVEEGVPCANTITRAVVAYLIAHGTSQSRICVVLGADSTQWLADMKRELADSGMSNVRVVKHEPTNQESHGYVGASESADAIYIQRDLFEAEVVLPIYCVRTPDSPSATDKYGMSPGFANAATQHRWNLAWLEDNQHHMHLQEKLSHEAGWMMGVQFAIAVVPSFDGGVSDILGGNADHVFTKACDMVGAEAGAADDPHDLVVAFVEGDASQQSWMNVARAVAHADMQLQASGNSEHDGAIVVCSDLDSMSQGILQLGTDEPEDRLQKRLLKSDLEDAFAAAVISVIKSKRSVYLMSRLTAHQVENIGLAHVDSESDILKLCHSSKSVCVMRSAQF